jgi:molybdenum cofactor cytidylyltransferase
VAGIVLAAGSSSRMGRNKLLLALGGETMLRRAVREAIAAELDPIIVVVGYEADLARREVTGLSCQVVVNPDYSQGMHRSLHAGMAALPPMAQAFVVVLPDMPFVTAAMMAALVVRYRTSTAPLVISDYMGVAAPPILYDRTLFEELYTTEGDGAGRGVVLRHRSEAVAVTWPAAALADLDAPGDYDRARAELHSGP